MNERITLILQSIYFPHIISFIIFVFYVILIKFCYKILNKIQSRLFLTIKNDKNKTIPGITIGDYQLLARNAYIYIASLVLKVTKVMVFIFILIFTLPTLFYLNPPTKVIASQLLKWIFLPISKIIGGVLEYLPNFITILIIILFIRYSLNFFRYISKEIEEEKVKIPGFYPEWASPTYSLLKICLYLLGLVVISPYLPGSGSAAFKGISIFIGFLISIGSSNYVGNLVAGFILTYMRSFQKGDRIKVDDTVGDVIERSLLVTRLKTAKNERVTIPNSNILSGSIINYTFSSSEYKLIIYTTITIGYDVDWHTVHRLLISSTKDIEGVLDTPPPFVRQKSLDDFYVTYEVNLYTKKEKKRLAILSDLHANIQENFHREGVEIMSPHYRVERDDMTPAIPKKFFDKEE